MPSFGQKITVAGIVTDKIPGLDLGDTIQVYGFVAGSAYNPNKYRIKNPSFVGDKLVDTDRVDLLIDELPFWHAKWFLAQGDQVNQLGWNYDVRKEHEQFALEYLEGIEQNGLIYDDPILEDYLYQLLSEIHPYRLVEGKPGNLNIQIMKSSEPNAIAFPNGTIIITTGMISSCRTEDELVAVLAHEVAHIVMDHSLSNYIAEMERAEKKRRAAEFWGGVAAVSAGVASGVAASQGGLSPAEASLVGATVGLAAGAITYGIAYEIAGSIGADYPGVQELEADKASQEFLLGSGRNPNALAANLIRLEDYFYKNGQYEALSESGSHPSLKSRVRQQSMLKAKLLKTKPSQAFADLDLDKADLDFDQRISNCLTFTAWSEYVNKRFKAAEDIVDRVLEAGVASELEYLLKSKLNRALYNSPEKNQESLDFVTKAESLDVENLVSVEKEKGIILLRLNRPAEAKLAFEKYEKNLNPEDPAHRSEIMWVRRMIYRCDKL